MQVLTDIDPATPACPIPRTSWARCEPAGVLRRIAAACFPAGATLFYADEEGRKLTAEFPLVVWRGNSPESQMDLAASLAGWLPEEYRTVVLVAGSGENFRGHFDRHWRADEGNLHVTVLSRETAPVAHVGMGYAILPVLALHDCVAAIATAQHTVRIRWINDILLDGAKVAGALSRGRIKGDIYTHAVFGMGLNVHTAPEIAPTPFVPRAAALGPLVGGRPLFDVFRQLLSAFASNQALLRREGAAGLLPRYRAAADFIGRAVRLYEDGPGLDDADLTGRRLLARGVVEGVSDDLQLFIAGKAYGTGRMVVDEG